MGFRGKSWQGFLHGHRLLTDEIRIHGQCCHRHPSATRVQLPIAQTDMFQPPARQVALRERQSGGRVAGMGLGSCQDWHHSSTVPMLARTAALCHAAPPLISLAVLRLLRGGPCSAALHNIIPVNCSLCPVPCCASCEQSCCAQLCTCCTSIGAPCCCALPQ